MVLPDGRAVSDCKGPGYGRFVRFDQWRLCPDDTSDQGRKRFALREDCGGAARVGGEPTADTKTGRSPGAVVRADRDRVCARKLVLERALGALSRGAGHCNALPT